MGKHTDGLLRVFWPETLARTTSSGVIVGWRNSDFDVFVVTVLEDVEGKVRNVESALRLGTLFRSSPYPVARIFQLCEQPAMFVLGTLNHPETSMVFDLTKLRFYNLPQQKALQVFCPASIELSVQVIYYDPPNPRLLEYMSLNPINLALGDSRSTMPSFNSNDKLEVAEQHEKERLAKLVDKLKYHTVVRHQPTHKEVILPAVLQQINCAQELGELIQKNVPLIGSRRKRTMSVSERVVERAQSLYALAAFSLWTLFMTYIFPGIAYAFKLAIILHRIVAEGILCCLELPLPMLRPVQLSDGVGRSVERLALKDISACCQQVHLRLQQFSYYPTQYTLLRKRHTNWSSIPSTNADYIRFYNSLWLVANDVILGIAVGSFINDNAEATTAFVDTIINQYTIEGLKSMIRWLMSYPGGLKLNTELAAFLGDLFLWVIEYWSVRVTVFVMPYLPTIIYLIGFSSFAGASMSIAIFSDLLSFLTVHIYSFYIASARIFNWQLTIIVSLFHLFRGKKRNMLRNRIDNCDYDLDQLLLGTILFTLLFFLLPTVVVFYLTFASARMAIISLKATLDTCLACLNHFPLFAIMLRVKDSRRLPSGVQFELLQDLVHLSPGRNDVMNGQARGHHMDEAEVFEDDNHGIQHQQSRTSYVRLSSTPLSMRQIFAPYFQLGGRIKQHYLSPTVGFRLFTGQFVPPLGRREMYGMQYSALPRQRIGVSQLWKDLFEESAVPVAQTYPKVYGGRGQHGSWANMGSITGRRWQ